MRKCTLSGLKKQSMNSDPSRKEKERRLNETRHKEEELYAQYLGLADGIHDFKLPEEISARYLEIKDALNALYEIRRGAFSAAQNEDRFIWKEVARNFIAHLEPLVRQQGEFNATLVHFLNEWTTSLSESLKQIRAFHKALMHVLMSVLPVLDARVSEVRLEQENTESGLKEHQRRLESMGISLRSLHHLANAWKSAGEAAGSPASVRQETQYYHFEEHFRGSRQEIKQKFEQYVPYFQDHHGAPVVDLGCGRGEFLELLKEAEIAAMGVDSNQNMVQTCQGLGLDVAQGDLLDFLLSQPENSLGGIFCSQVIEHLPPELLMKLLAAAHVRLKEGAPILLETVNIASAFAFHEVYSKDLTHRTLIHPETLEFLVTAHGFQKPRRIFVSPVSPTQSLSLFPDSSDPDKLFLNETITKLNRVIFGYMEYALLAFK